MKSLVDELKGKIGKISQGGGEKSIQRHLSQGKMLVRERITTLLDPGLVITSKPRLLNLILLNLIVRWSMGAAIVRPPNTEYTQSIV